jgi:hypothetical protein
MLIFDHCFVSKASDVKAFKNAHPEKEIPNKTTIRQLVTTFPGARSVYVLEKVVGIC